MSESINISNCKASRKADRLKIAAEYRRIGEKFGATIEEREESLHAGYSGAGIKMSFTLNGVGASLSISDLHERHGSPGGLISWFNDQPSGEWHERYQSLGYGVYYFTPGFNVAVGESGSARPHHKATSCGSWEILAARLQAGLRKASTGEAFTEARTVVESVA